MNQPPLIFALDISKTRTGICEGRAGDTPRFVSLQGKDMTGVEAGWQLLAWLVDRAKVDKPDLVAFEAPLERIGGGGSGIKTIIILHCLAFLVEVFCCGKRIPFRKAHVSTVRKSFIGSGNLKSAEAEKRIGATCRLLGWAPKNHDEADAGAVWHWACGQIAPRYAQHVSSLDHVRIAGGEA